MLSILRAPSGGWERTPEGYKGRQLWYNKRGVRTLTKYAKDSEVLYDWYDFVIHIPVVEKQTGPADESRPFDATAKQTYYPVSDETVPGLVEELMKTAEED